MDEAIHHVRGRFDPLRGSLKEAAFVDHEPLSIMPFSAVRPRDAYVRTAPADIPSIAPASSEEKSRSDVVTIAARSLGCRAFSARNRRVVGLHGRERIVLKAGRDHPPERHRCAAETLAP